MRDVSQKRGLPVKVGCLLRTVPHPEAGALVVFPNWPGKISIAHQSAEDNLHLRFAEEVGLGEHDTVTDRDVTGLSPPARSTDEVIAGQVHDGTTMPRTSA